jgi:hypothetical protein
MRGRLPTVNINPECVGGAIKPLRHTSCTLLSPSRVLMSTHPSKDRLDEEWRSYAKVNDGLLMDQIVTSLVAVVRTDNCGREAC